MENTSPFITIIIAALNSEKTISQCLQSIASQTYKNWELILIDGGSVDGTVSVIQAYRDMIAYWESEPDNGIYHAWNKALNHASGEWICFLGSDDYFHDRHVLERYLPHLTQAVSQGIRVVYGQIERINRDGQIVQVWGKPWEKIKWQMPHGMPLGMPHTGLMHHIGLFKDHGFFDDELNLAGDYEFLLRELKDKNRKALFAEGLTTVVQRIGGAADSNSLAFHREVSKARLKNGFSRWSWLWCLVHLRSYIRRQTDKLGVRFK